MTPAPRYVLLTSTQAWQLMEQDYTLRFSLVAHRWAEKHLRGVNAVVSETLSRGNAAYYFPARVDLEIETANQQAEWCFKTCCEIWEIQGRTKSRPFFRAIFDGCLKPRFSNIFEQTMASIRLQYTRTRRPMFDVDGHRSGHLKREIGRLCADWNTRLEIAARDAAHEHRYQEQLAHERDLREQRSLGTAFAATRVLAPIVHSDHVQIESMPRSDRGGGRSFLFFSLEGVGVSISRYSGESNPESGVAGRVDAYRVGIRLCE
jgi:hypothetical protein